MPLFPDYNALFIHIPKTAGRSIEAALFPAGVGSASGRRSVWNRAAHLLQGLTASPVATRHLVGTRDQSLCAQHLTLAEIELLGLVPARQFAQVVSFCVVRNPFTRAISSVLHFRTRLAGFDRIGAVPAPAEIERTLEVWAELDPADHNQRAHRRPQADFVFRRGQPVAVDRVLRFETLRDDFAAFATEIGAPVDLPFIGRSGTAASDYGALYTPRARQIVAQLYEADFELFGYRSGVEAA